MKNNTKLKKATVKIDQRRPLGPQDSERQTLGCRHATPDVCRNNATHRVAAQTRRLNRKRQGSIATSTRTVLTTLASGTAPTQKAGPGPAAQSQEHANCWRSVPPNGVCSKLYWG